MIENRQSVIYPISKKEFFKQPQYKRERIWIYLAAVFMYMSAVAGGLSLAMCAGRLRSLYEFVSVIGVPLAIFGVIMGSFILIKKDSTCCIVSCVVYSIALPMFAMFDIIIIVLLAMASALAGASFDELAIFVPVSLILQLFIVMLPFIGSLLATMGSLKINKDWEKYKKCLIQ